MKLELLVCVKVEREKFEHEVFCGDDNIFGLLKSGEFVFDCGEGAQYVKAYEGVVFKKGITYKRKVTKPLEMYLFRYRASEDFFAESKIVFKDLNHIKSTLNLLEQIENNYTYSDFEYKKMLLSDIFTQYIIENKCTGLNLPEDAVVSAALVEIRKNLNKNIKPEQLAKKSYLSYVQFSRRFKNAVGITPQEFINNMRMEKARYMLSQSSLSIKKIADECGFSNEYYFSNFFKKYNNVSPAEYRKMSDFLV